MTSKTAWLAKNRNGIKIIGGTDAEAPPTFTATNAERDTIWRFLTFALNDLGFQGAKVLREEGQTLLDIRRAKADIAFLAGYVKKLREGVDEMIETPKELDDSGS